ncbi:MAG: histidine kinase [Alphaproteobacteria bacterium]|nr:histidine kinase [Alphaproteobacteria bacterium]
MLSPGIILLAAFGYLCLLFAIAYYGDKRADAGRSLVANPYIYALSIAVYCTAWTFFGSVGRAAANGMDFLTIYLGPTLVFVLCWFILRKIVRISKVNRITSIADFISARYGKTQLLGGLVTVIAVVGIVPYISLQLKAVSSSFNVLIHYPDVTMPGAVSTLPMFQDTALYVALILATFSILFGTRHIDASEHHEGMVAAIAFESVVKLVAFLSVGAFIAFGIHDGFDDLFAKAMAEPEIRRLLTTAPASAFGNWMTLMVLSMAAIVCLPRQWHVTVVENVDENHLDKAVWLFPLYLLLINIFVLPVAVAGLLAFRPEQVDADMYVLVLPMLARQEGVALIAFIGGLSAATGMVIVETVALSTMVCNDLVMPVLLRWRWLRLTERADLSRLLLGIRRGSIVGVVLLSYLYFRLIGESYALVTIGLVSFTAAAQFAPAIIGGIFWKSGNRWGALAGLGAGFLTWGYTLLLPSFVRSGWLDAEILTAGPFGMGVLPPQALFGLTGLDPLTHALFWTMLVNVGAYIGVSLLTHQSALERIQASTFVDVFRRGGAGQRFWRGTATVADLEALLVRFIGAPRARQALADYARQRDLNLGKLNDADADLVQYVERLLAGAIGAASARVMIASVAKGEIMSLDEVMAILDEASQIIEYSRRLEQKSQELEVTSAELRAANERLKELDRMKDDFISTVSHELRTPLTSIRSFGEILFDNPTLDIEQRREFLGIIVKESERLTRLINQILDLAKMEAGRMDWQIAKVELKDVVADALAVTRGLFAERQIRLEVRVPDDLPPIEYDRDRLIQVIVNLLSNAVKFCDAREGFVGLEAAVEGGAMRVTVRDNGPGVSQLDQPRVFERFQQVGNTMTAKPQGTGLGLAICRQIVERFGGRIWVESEPGRGAAFSFLVPIRLVAAAAQ